MRVTEWVSCRVQVARGLGFERTAFALYLLSIAAFSLQRFPRLPWKGVQISDVVFFGAFLLWLIAVITRQIEWKSSKVYGPLTLYVAAMGMSLFNTPTVARSLMQLVANCYLMAILMLTLHFAHSPERIRYIVVAFLLGVAVSAVAALTGVGYFYVGVPNSENPFFWHYGTLPPGVYPRVSGSFMNGNALCNYLVVGMFVLAGFWHELQRWASRGLLLSLGLAMGGAALFTFSVGWGGLVAGAMVVLWQQGYRRHQLPKSVVHSGMIIGAVFLICLTFVSVVMLTDPVQSFAINEGRLAIVTPAEQGVTLPGGIARIGFEPSVRVATWIGALQTIERYPLIGQGIGTRVAPTVHRLVTGGEVSYRDAHSAPLNILGQTGAIGFFAFCFFLWKLLKGSLREAYKDHRLLSLLAAASGAFFFQGLFGSVEEARHLWVLFGMIAGLRAEREQIG